MEQYLFRGIKEGTNEFVYGSLLQSEIDVNKLNIKCFICERFMHDAQITTIPVIPSTVGMWTYFEASGGKKIFFGDRVEVCVFFVSPSNTDEDIHFRGVVEWCDGITAIRISEFMFDEKGWKPLTKGNLTGFPFDRDYIEDGIFTMPLFALMAMSGNRGEWSEENIEVTGNIHQSK